MMPSALPHSPDGLPIPLLHSGKPAIPELSLRELTTPMKTGYLEGRVWQCLTRCILFYLVIEAPGLALVDLASCEPGWARSYHGSVGLCLDPDRGRQAQPSARCSGEELAFE